jgi:acyl carrier protein
MTKEIVFEKVQEVFRDVFDDEDLVIHDSTNSSDIEDWDSLNHINLVVVIENELNIKFNFEELSRLKNVGAMIDLIIIKLKN